MVSKFHVKCCKCGKQWNSTDEFLEDADWYLNGYQEGFFSIGRFLITHSTPECRGSFTIGEEDFAMLLGIPCPRPNPNMAVARKRLREFVQQVMLAFNDRIPEPLEIRLNQKLT